MSMRWSSSRTCSCTTLNHLPDMLTGEPWVRWPPQARSRPMKVSPGFISAMNTAWLAWLPEFGCTLANGSRTAGTRARSRAPRRYRRTGSRRNSAGADSPRRICWSSPSLAPRAPPSTRCSRRRSARSRRAGGRVRARWRAAISGSLSARLAEKKLLDMWLDAWLALMGNPRLLRSPARAEIRRPPRGRADPIDGRPLTWRGEAAKRRRRTTRVSPTNRRPSGNCIRRNNPTSNG